MAKAKNQKIEEKPERESKVGHIEGILKDMERNVTKKKSRSIAEINARIEEIQKMKKSIEKENTKQMEKMQVLETQLKYLQKRVDDLSELEERIEKLDIETEEEIRAVERRVKTPLKAALQLETEVRKSFPAQIEGLKKNIEELRKELRSIKQMKGLQDLEVFEHRIEFIENQLDSLLEKTGGDTTIKNLQESNKTISDRQNQIIENIKELSSQQEVIVENLTAFAKEKEEIKENIANLKNLLLKGVETD